MPPLKVDDDMDIKYFTKDEIRLLDSYFEGTTAQTAYYLGRYCGLRINETFGIKWSNIDFENNLIIIDRQMQVYSSQIAKLSESEYMQKNSRNEFNMVVCKKCGCVYHWSIKKCPECGRPQRAFYQKPIFYILLVAISFGLLCKFGIIDVLTIKKSALQDDEVHQNSEIYEEHESIDVENGTLFKEPEGELLYPFSITNTTENDCYVYLRDLDASNDCAFYVTSGEKVSINMPLGEYELYYCSGRKWYGEDKLFGAITETFKANKIYEFYDETQGYLINHRGWSVTIEHTTFSGNTQKVPLNSFPH